jgi:hypothetical protein
MKVIQKTLKKSWAFSNLVSFCKIHLFNYIHLLLLIENPDKDWQKQKPNIWQPELFIGSLLLKILKYDKLLRAYLFTKKTN